MHFISLVKAATATTILAFGSLAFAKTHISCTSIGPFGHYGYSLSVTDRSTAPRILESEFNPLDISGASRTIKLIATRNESAAGVSFTLVDPAQTQEETSIFLEIVNQFDGEFYPGSLSGVFEGQSIAEELICEGEDPALTGAF